MLLYRESGYRVPMREHAIIIALILSAALPSPTSAEPHTLALSRPQSSVRFGLSAPTSALHMNGSVSDFTGSLIFDDKQDSITHAQFSLDLSSAKLPPNQVLQAILLQTLLSKVQQRRTTFESSEIEHITASTYLVSGSYRWLDKTRYAKIPIQLEYASPTRAEVTIALDGPLKPPRSNSSDVKGLGEVPANASGWARAKLTFTASPYGSGSTTTR